MSNVAVAGCTLEPVSPATGTITINPNQESQDTSINGNGVYFKEIKFSVSGSNGGGSVTNNDGTGDGSITASGAGMTDANGNMTVLEGDFASVLIKGTSGQSSASGTIMVKVTKAGQTDVSLT